MKKLLLGSVLVVGLITIASACSYTISSTHGNVKRIKCSNGEYHALVFKDGKWEKQGGFGFKGHYDSFSELANRICGCN